MLKAVTRQASLVDSKIRAVNADLASHNLRAPISTAYFFDHLATPEDLAVMVTETDFLEAHRELVPSVSAGELAHYEQVRASFEGAKDKEKEKMGGAADGARLALPAGAAGTGAAGGRRSASGASARSASSKGKGRALALSSASSSSYVGKGKGKAVALGSGDELEGGGSAEEGSVIRDKGKGKAVAPPIADGATPFGDGVGSGDEGLYD